MTSRTGQRRAGSGKETGEAGLAVGMVRGWWRRVRAAIAKAIGSDLVRSPERGAGRSIAGGSTYDVRKLIAALAHPNPNVRVGAAHQLGALGASQEPGPGTGGVSGAGAAKATAKATGPGPVDVIVSALIDALEDDDPSVRSSVALSLGDCGAAAVGAIPALIATLAEADDDVRSSAGIALEDIGEAARVPLEEALGHPDLRVREEAEAILLLMADRGSP